VGRLVALDMAGGPRFVDELQRAWDAGDAILPIDQRLPAIAKRDLMDDLAPESVVTGDGNRVSCPDSRPTDEGDAVVVATSGSTGTPRGVVLTHDAVAASSAATSRRLGVTADDHWLACLPLSHVGGLSVVMRGLHAGTRLTVHPGFDADRVMASGANLVSLVPTALRRIDPERFRWIVLGGSRPPTERPANTVTTYGMTETGSGVVYDGRSLDDVEIRIIDDEIQLRCPMLLRCYRDGTDPRTDDGWYPTGDLGEIDDNGLVHVHGRRGDLIITGGENVWPEPVEAILRDYAGIDDVAIVGTPDHEWGHIVTAHVVLADRTIDIPLEALRSAVKARLPGYCAPRSMVVVDQLPRTTLGKLVRSQLRPPDRH